MGRGRRRSLLPLLLPLLPLLPAAWGDCGPLPNISHAEPPEDAKHQERFTVGSKVTYRCLGGFVKRPLLQDTVQCLTNSQWSNLPQFCGRSCPSPPRLPFARISQEDGMQNYFAVGSRVRYTCRPGYENSTDQLPTSTCLDNLTWSQVPELCQRKSCGVPANPEHGKVIAKDHLFLAKAEVVCNRGYSLKGASSLIRCLLRGSEVAWSQLPVCQAISCPPPPAIPNGKHNSSSTEEFTYSSAVVYTCEPGLQLVGNKTLHCTTENGADGVWSGSPPECRVSTTAAANQTESSEETMAENPYWLAGILIASCSAFPVALLAGIIMRWKDHKKQLFRSYSTHLQEPEKKGKDLLMPPVMRDGKKQPVPWQSYFGHGTSCHVCGCCTERLHAAAGPCAACQRCLRARPGTPRSYRVPSASGDDGHPVGTSSAKAAEVPRGEGTGEAAPEQSEAEQPTDHKSHHVCPICENWLRAHFAQHQGHPTVPREQLGETHQQDEGPQGPVCLPCADRLHLSLVHSDVASCPVCPLAAEGALAHLIPQHSPICHLCPICVTPTHRHLCQPQRIGVDGCSILSSMKLSEKRGVDTPTPDVVRG
ncbi:complement decay-accelerating factor isoform X3 [Colius striatus]|uniref:complement decay-accelerating factor isoform X3 n=1 Tax=Colius striatus TaxID=57412 RepID=UPI002B1E569E|nr:complement decay-accelerating factor isoform X3 [Colius striatus]